MVLEDQVRRRTNELEHALELLNRSNARLGEAMQEAEAARGDMASAIEAVREGFALFGADDVLKLFNRRFCWNLPDVRESLEEGQTFESYIDRVSRSRNLVLSEGVTPQLWARDRMQRHREDRVNFNLALKGDRWLQISEHRTRTGGTAIVHTDVTDLVNAERMEREKLLDSQARMIRATLDHLDQGVAIFDEQGRLVRLERAAAPIDRHAIGRLATGHELCANRRASAAGLLDAGTRGRAPARALGVSARLAGRSPSRSPAAATWC